MAMLAYRERSTVIRYLILAGAVCLTAAVAASGQSVARTNRGKQVDSIFSDVDKKDSPGCALAVIQAGKIAYQRGYGMANLDYGIPISPESIFYIASDSKQFTAFSVALLVEDGKIALSDPVTKYIPELPSAVYGQITIEQLVHHTSGVRDYWGLQQLAGRPDDPLTQDDFLNLMARQKELNSKPGEQHSYSNAGYALLAILVERVSGKNLPAFAEEKIFGPLGMKHTSFEADHTAPLKNLATGYVSRDGGDRKDTSLVEPLGDGGLRTTLGDLFLWDQNFYNNKLGNRSPDLIKLVQSPGTLNDGKSVSYAFGLAWGADRGLKFIGHSGSGFGFRSYMTRFPDQRFSVICLCNSDSPMMAPWSLGRKVADVYLAGQFKVEPPKQAPSTPPAKTAAPADEEKPIHMSEEELARYAGTFQDKTDESVWRFSMKDGSLTAGTEGITFPLEPVSPTHFRGVGAPMSVDLFFSAAEPSPGRTVDVQAGSQPRYTLEPIALVTPIPSELLAYAGDYYSDEVDTTYQVYVADGKLYIRQEHGKPVALGPLVKDEFQKGRRKVKFGRNSSGEIADVRMDAEGVSSLRFVRKF